MFRYASVALAAGAALINLDVAMADHEPVTDGFGVAAGGAAIVERYRSEAGVHYALSDDWLISLSLGISPADLADRPLPWSPNTRWLPHFAAYQAEPAQARHTADAPPTPAPERSVQWFWTIGTDSRSAFRRSAATPSVSHPLDIRSDFIAEFSLQTKAGFVLPVGKRLLLGGALTLDRRIAEDSLHLDPTTDYLPGDDDSDAAAYVGVEWKY